MVYEVMADVGMVRIVVAHVGMAQIVIPSRARPGYSSYDIAMSCTVMAYIPSEIGQNIAAVLGFVGPHVTLVPPAPPSSLSRQLWLI